MAKEEDLQRLNAFMTGFFEVAKSDPAMGKGARAAMPLLIKEMAKSSNLESSAKIAEVIEEALAQATQEEEEQRQMEMQQAQDEREQAMDNVKAPTVNIAFKDLPPAGKIQAAAKYGIELTPDDVLSAMTEEEEPPIDMEQDEEGAYGLV